MAVYPSSLPTSADIPDMGANLGSNPHTALHDDLRNEVVAIAAELGVQPSGSSATVKARFDVMSTPVSWTPVLTATSTNPTLGTGSAQEGQWLRHGRMVTVWARIRFGTSGVNAGSGVYIVSLPVAAAAALAASTSAGAGQSIGVGGFRDDSTTSNNQSLAVQLRTTTTVQFTHSLGAVQNNSPITFAASDVITFTASYLTD